MAPALGYIESSTWTATHRGEPFLNRNLKRIVDPTARHDKHATVIYVLGIRDEDSTALPKKLTVKGHCCAICNTLLGSWNILRFHLQTNHDANRFTFWQSPNSESTFFVEMALTATLPQDSGLYRETIQMGQPREMFNLDRYLEGDRSWITDRPGPKDTSDLAGWRGSLVRSRSRRLREQGSRQQPVLVPDIRTHLYDPISISPLKAGERIPPSGLPKDAYGIKEHTAVINEFIDVSDDEKDFICRWDAFALPRSLTSNHGIQKAMVDFVRENGNWFAQRDSRAKEFGSHATALTMKGLITMDCWRQCAALLRAFAEERFENEKQIETDKETRRYTTDDGGKMESVRGRRDCVCGGQPTPSEALLCCGRGCKFRMHHLSCMGLEAKRRPARWKCKSCEGD